jgi:hypothetical protein
MSIRKSNGGWQRRAKDAFTDGDPSLEEYFSMYTYTSR